MEHIKIMWPKELKTPPIDGNWLQNVHNVDKFGGAVASRGVGEVDICRSTTKGNVNVQIRLACPANPGAKKLYVCGLRDPQCSPERSDIFRSTPRPRDLRNPIQSRWGVSEKLPDFGQKLERDAVDSGFGLRIISE
jgi:hypothetical protein